MQQSPIVIVGGGLAGLSAAVHLHRAGRAVRVLEASDRVGGRVATDAVDGFLLDRGFQVLLESYPEAQALLDYDALDLRRFMRGADVRFDGKFHRVADPREHLDDVISTVLSPIFSYGDMLAVLRLPSAIKWDTASRPEWLHAVSTRAYLAKNGISWMAFNRFFKPFFGGVFLEPDLDTPASMFAFLFQLFANGHASLPAHGMGAIPAQLAAQLPEDCIWTNSRVTETWETGVKLENGEQIEAEAVVIATDADSAAGWEEALDGLPWRSTVTLYFRAENAPSQAAILMLNGSGDGLINSVSVPSVLSPHYAPKGQHLISVSVVGDPELPEQTLTERVQGELVRWFGRDASSWGHLRNYHIPRALPRHDQLPASPPETMRMPNGKYRCGDYCVNASINGALQSGRLVAEEIVGTHGEIPAPELSAAS